MSYLKDLEIHKVEFIFSEPIVFYIYSLQLPHLRYFLILLGDQQFVNAPLKKVD